jgi:hypothetical protein
MRRLAVEAALPMAIPGQQLVMALAGGRLQPGSDRRLVEMDEDALAELLDRRQPVRTAIRFARFKAIG